MSDRIELQEAALVNYPGGIALLDRENQVQLWNRAAEIMTGYRSVDVVSRSLPEAVAGLLEGVELRIDPASWPPQTLGAQMRLQHKLGHDLMVQVRQMVLRGDLGERIGVGIYFRLAETSALPHGECAEDSDVGASQLQLEQRLMAALKEYEHGGPAFSLLWIFVDQAPELRKTHGAAAAAGMFDKLERVVANGLRPDEAFGRWGDDEFLILTYEPSLEHLSVHAQTLTGLARTTDFRWWGDRVSLTVSIGAAQINREESLPGLLERAQAAMQASFHAGGNHITLAPATPVDE